MSVPAETPRRPLSLVVILVIALVATSVVLVVVTARPAAALHQHCGDDLVGTWSTTTGHPEPTAEDPGWGGQEILQRYAIVLRALGFARSIVQDIVAGFDAAADLLEAVKEEPVAATLAAGTPLSQVYAAAVYAPLTIGEAALRVILLVIQIVDLALLIAETVLGAIVMEIEFRVEDEDACGGTLSGDTLTMTWVAMVQQNLASAGPPLALLMTPSDPGFASEPRDWPLLPRGAEGDFPWCPPIPDEVRRELPGSPVGNRPTRAGTAAR